MNIRYLLHKLYFLSVGKLLPTDVFAQSFPVSVKGIVKLNDKVVLLRNERGEWDLPGGELSRNESITDCLGREINEELGIWCKVGDLVATTQVRVKNMIDVVVIIYECHADVAPGDLVISSEHTEVGCFRADELENIQILPQYRLAVLQNLM